MHSCCLFMTFVTLQTQQSIPVQLLYSNILSTDFILQKYGMQSQFYFLMLKKPKGI